MNSLELLDIHKRFGAHTALRGLNLRIGSGRIVCLLGASGSGKTTLLRIVAGLESPDGGTVRIAGQTVAGPGQAPLEPERRGLGMVFQDYALWPHLSALDNVALPLRARRQAAAAEQALDMLRRVGLDAMRERRPHELSGGQQQRVALARALAVRPRLLLCDEPLSNLDAGLREELRELIGGVVREHGLSALYITHDHREAFALGDEVGILDEGVLRQLDAPRRLLAAPRDEQVARFVHAPGPWTLRREASVLHAPWGPLPAETGAGAALRAADGARLYLPGAALRAADGAPRDGESPVSAEVSRCVATPRGAELQATLHGVALRVISPAWHAPGDPVELYLDLRQALIYEGPASARGRTDELEHEREKTI
ncbi:MAG: ABC transporter ATP-binding protein [Betaproteobacteria bacterium]|nr:ABC transporter ATP-binding protein [Betaproteobacteria bacterium]MBU6511723.1 ABC transporter ATP-binding protein [Betaproteobacteria bacterium]MDE1954216.1 ABC transporter ATP-binding protein [Betaproteobacteria bacterium]MDE2151663.1 ABC transporter ATP-binding protein [Betaproteobacteria bacterium]MDE2478124.1 ABC transporter ATP-binding protein [Betaproteobacteria bacterium]